MKTCKYCGKPLTLTPEYDTCMECQGRIMREATMPQNSFTTNSTKTATKVITHEEAKINVSAINGWHSEELENELMDYITQQEKKEERVKKVEELLVLKDEEIYHLDNMLAYLRTQDMKKYELHRLKSIETKNQIKLIEKELGEMK